MLQAELSSVRTTGTARHVGEKKVCQQNGALPFQVDTAVSHASNLQVHGWRHCKNQHKLEHKVTIAGEEE